MSHIFFRNVLPAGIDRSQYDTSVVLKKRPGFNSTGKRIQVIVNAYVVLKFPSMAVYQYDVSS